jgi:glycosyltransferase involved in cell wall biosynthesis
MGTPVVASRIGGLPEVVSDGIEGFLFDPGDGAAMQKAVERILADRDLRHKMSEAAIIKARAFAASVVVPQIEEMYVSSINNPRRVVEGSVD